MAQTFFIDLDEEIISVIGRLRKSSDFENYFVFPKRSLVLQSAVNLRLFQREAEKQGKHITIISQDESGRKLAERVGIPTKDYTAEVGGMRQEGVKPISGENVMSRTVPNNTTSIPITSTANHIGSPNFSGIGPATVSAKSIVTHPSSAHLAAASSSPVPQVTSQHRLRIRDMSPKYQTALNSQREEMNTQSNRSDRGNSTFASPPMQQSGFGVRDEDMYQQNIPINTTVSVADRNEKLQRFFNRDQTSTPPRAEYSLASKAYPRESAPVHQVKAQDTARATAKPASAGWKSFSIAIFSLVSIVGIGGAVYYFVPKATVIITPHEISHAVQGKYEGRTIAPIGDNQNDDVVPVRKIEKTYASKITVEATGKTSSGNQKSRGTIIISNEYSSDSQPLISTTRFETQDGKIFRLVESTVVPGMSIVNGKREPGIVEAVVIADSPGDAYNINPTTFTVPGFKGSSKYTTFHATSTKPFVGGGGGEEGITSITKEDIERSFQKLKEQSKKDFIATVEQELMPDERIIDDSLEITDTGKASFPLIGSIGERFDVEGNYTGKIFVISEKILKEKLARRNIPDEKGVTFKVTDATIAFDTVIPRYEEDSIDFNVNANLTLTSVIATDALRNELLGQNEDGIKAVLERHPELKKIEVNFSPEFLFQNIPKNSKRVSVEVVSGR